MEETMVLFTHTDLDGMGCAVLTRLVYNKYYIAFCKDEKSIDEKFDDFRKNVSLQGPKTILVADQCFSMDKCREIDKDWSLKGEIRVIDHHKSRLKEQGCGEFSWVNITPETNGRLECGTSLLYQQYIREGRLYPTPALDTFVELVRVRDVEWSNPLFDEATKLNNLFLALGKEEFINEMKDKLGNVHKKFAYTEREDAIIKDYEQKYNAKVEEYATNMRLIDFDGFKAGFVKIEPDLDYQSNVPKLVRTLPVAKEIQIMVMPNGHCVSLRRIDEEIDLSVIAKNHGGGGSPWAGAFPLENLPDELQG